MEHTTNTGRVCMHSAFLSWRSPKHLLKSMERLFQTHHIKCSLLSRFSRPTCHWRLKRQTVFASWNCHWKREWRSAHTTMAEWQALASGLPRIKQELHQSKSTSHLLYSQLKKHKQSNQNQPTTGKKNKQPNKTKPTNQASIIKMSSKQKNSTYHPALPARSILVSGQT